MNMGNLKDKSLYHRKQILEVCYKLGGHVSSSYSCVEIMVSLFYEHMKNYIPGVDKINRDKFILSKGHAENIYYSVLADLNFFPRNWLFNEYRSGNFYLGGHPSHEIPGVEITTGSLGHGLSIGCGMALSDKLKKRSFTTFVLLGDAECSEGSVWEAANFAYVRGLNNLVAVIDDNGIGATDFTINFIGDCPLLSKWRGFGWNVYVLDDGHNIDKILNILREIKSNKTFAPSVIIAKTVKGKGCTVFENDPKWHSNKITEDDYKKALLELNFEGN